MWLSNNEEFVTDSLIKYNIYIIVHNYIMSSLVLPSIIINPLKILVNIASSTKNAYIEYLIQNDVISLLKILVNTFINNSNSHSKSVLRVVIWLASNLSDSDYNNYLFLDGVFIKQVNKIYKVKKDKGISRETVYFYSNLALNWYKIHVR